MKYLINNLRKPAWIATLMLLLAACSPRPAAPPGSAPTFPAAATRPAPTITPVETTTQAQTEPPMPATPLPSSESARLSLPPADAASTRLRVLPGFAIRIFADNLGGRPRFMAFGPDSALYLALSGAGQIVRLADANRDGLADANPVVAGGLNRPHGLAWHEGWLYVAENDRIQRFHSSMGDGVLDVKELVTDNIPGGGGHFTRSVHFGPDGMMYVSAGSSCNVCAESDPRRAAILRFNPDGSIPADNPYAADADVRKRPLWASGLRNSVDFLWTPSGEMWASTNGRDNLKDANGLPDALPPEVIVFPIRSGGFYGWPYCYNPVSGYNAQGTAQVLDQQSGLALPSGLDCAQAIPALFSGLAHYAPLGMAFAQAGNFPPSYQSDLYVAYHGSWNVQDPANIRDCKVERVVVEDGKPVRSETFVDGWRAPGGTCGDPSTYGRPAGIAFGPDGAMYISDDADGRVYRLIYTP